MTDPTPNAPMPTPLSPAAQVIKNAVLALDPDRKTFKWVWSLCRPIAAAALRALADQVVPETEQPGHVIGFELGDWDARRDVRSEILDIATELENQ